MRELVKKVKGRWGTIHYETADKPKGDYQLPSMIGYVFDSQEEALKAITQRIKENEK